MKKQLLLLKMTVALLFIATHLFSQNWNEVMKTVASDREEFDNYGWSVSISGNYAIVGAHQESEDPSSNILWKAGSAYILEKDESGYWNQVQKIVASDRDSQDHFGISVSISGNYAIVGAYQEDEDVSGGNTMSNTGAAYIFERDGSGNWTEVQKIVASDRYYGDFFGYSVDISGDFAIVGANEKGRNASIGAVYIFKRNDQGNWIETQILEGDYVAPFQYISPFQKFGECVSISEKYCIVGATYEDEVDENGGQVKQAAGAAYIYEKDGSENWNQVARLVAPVRRVNAHFGSGVSVSGNYAIVGEAQGSYDEMEGDSLWIAGSAYMYERDGSGNWNMVQKIVPSDRAQTDVFGHSVSISGNMAVVGAYNKTEGTMGNYLIVIGASYIFSRNGSGIWEEMTKLSASDGSERDQFGWAVALSGNYAIISAPYNEMDTSGENFLSDAGSAYIFSYCSAVEKNNPITICNGDSILLGGEYQLASGTFYDTLRASTGCDSIVVSELTVNVVDTDVAVAGATLTASTTTGSYQWIDCATMQNIQSETNQSYTPTVGGTYALELTQNGCVDTTSCYTISFVGIEDIDLAGSVKVYPNPVNNLLNIEMDKVFEVTDIRILNILGKEVMHKRFVKEQLFKINIAELPVGPYFIQIQTPEGNATLRVIKNE